ncbi:protein of unknown function (plasmid) [Cupriavidus taiwanensis]|uniref:Uncharacterized protein n=1 Tax=Cupriavidus taiwanensis TaxID=164546 RepID=A0A7Z7JF51_9BURK|nr:protein of unknown function [Cupriavidus taiwanensis]SOZ12182.1 protein of unknown function [Cupriavidus taiwanensis]SOZ43487.1 protein of unknown function [Cupriavidus taiwanensis]SPC22729.1 protein of unknown function [Cupriavidus taiwanensis]SPD54240.1 protein of unknown function [Cupriavidus taiwanensis]
MRYTIKGSASQGVKTALAGAGAPRRQMRHGPQRPLCGDPIAVVRARRGAGPDMSSSDRSPRPGRRAPPRGGRCERVPRSVSPCRCAWALPAAAG